MKYIKSSIAFIFLTFILISLYIILKPNTWEAYYKHKLTEPPRDFIVTALKELPQQTKSEIIALDLGAGVGHETLLLLKKGYYVIAVDSQKSAFDFMLERPEIIKYQDRLKTVVSSFEELDLDKIPPLNLVVTSFALPFCHPDHFENFWKKIVDKIESGGYFIGNTFDPGFTAFDDKVRKEMTFHTKEQTIDLFDNFEILSLREIKEEGKEVGKFDHYYEIIAKKK